jgi:O-antigen/teichoic acid export membrane protein
MNDRAHLPDARGDRLVHSTFALLISNGSGVVLGLTFWAVAARQYSKSNVGYGATEVSAMTLCAAFGLLNLGTIFPRFLYPAGARAGRVLRSGYLAATTVALVAALLFVEVARGPHSAIQPGFWSAAFFVVAVVLWVVFTIEDAALVGLRATFWVPVENTSFSVVKILLLPAFAVVAPRAGVFTSWVLPVIACVAAINVYLFRRVLPEHERHAGSAGVLPERRVVRLILFGEYLGGLSTTAMATLPAIMITATLGAKQTAFFQTPWIAGTAFDGLLFAFATVLTVEATARPTAAPALVRRSVHLAVRILAPGIVVVLVSAPWLLRILGADYAAHGTRLLQLLALAMPFMAVNVLYVTYARLARRVRRVFLVQVAIAAIVLTLTYLLLTPLGINGAGVALLAGQGLAALALLPSVVRQYRRSDMSPGFAPGTSLVVRSASGDATTPSAAFLGDATSKWSPLGTLGPSADVPAVWKRRRASGDAPKEGGTEQTETH